MNVSSALATALEHFPPEDRSQACAEEDPELFFIPDGTRGEARRKRVQLALKVCRRCDYRGPCLEYALALDTRFGVWGGQSFDEQHPNGHPPHHRQPKGPTMPKLSDTARQAAELLDATEGHPDPSVRAVRKIAAQSLTALASLVAARQVAAVGPNEPATPAPPKARAGKSPVSLLLDHHGVTSATVREWAITHGHMPVGQKGALPRRIADLYVEAHA